MRFSPGTLTAPELPPGRRAALVIATNSYADPELRALRAPARDAEDLAEVLADPAIGGFSVTTQIDQREGTLRRSIARFLADRVPEDVVLLYLSCHGVPDARGRLFFAATDTEKDLLAVTAVSAAEVVDLLDGCRARQQLLILDCCFSGAFHQGAKGGLDLERQLAAGSSRGRLTLTSSRASEYSFEGESLTSHQTADGDPTPGSVFTTGLVAGLRTGAADTDQDGLISAEDAYAFAFQHVRAAGARQTPQRWLHGGEDRPIILARSPAGRVVIPAKLPESLVACLHNPHPTIRIATVQTIAELLADPDPAQALAAEQALRHVAENDIVSVSAAAQARLPRQPAALAPPPQPAEPGPLAAARPLKRPRKRTPATGQPGPVTSLAFSRNGWLLAVACGEFSGLWDIRAGVRVRALRGDGDQVKAVAFRPDGRVLATAGGEAVRLLDPDTGGWIGALDGDTEGVTSVAFSPDGRMLATGGALSAVRLWDVATGRPLHRLLGNATSGRVNGTTTVAFSPAGRHFAASSASEEFVRIWDPGTGRLLRTLGGHCGGVLAVAFSSDGRLLATGGNDAMARLWSPSAGEHVRALTAHTQPVTALAFSLDGRTLATSDGGTTRVWDMDVGEDLGFLFDHAAQVSAVAFSPDGRLLAVGSRDGAVGLWRMSSGAPPNPAGRAPLPPAAPEVTWLRVSAQPRPTT